uniref:185/333 n=1 Tax=Strongylocentrotus intermedius TaxID=7667 RepID=E2JF12_STRIE|nr:185/333 [Strongylocentrotus intermedius]
MEVKVTLIVAIVAALAISAHAQRDFNERRGNENGRERGQGRFGGRPDGMQMGGPRQDGGPMGGRRFDGPESGAPQMDGRRQNGGPMGGRRFDGPGFGGSRPDGAGGRPFFGQGGRRGDGDEETDAAQQIGDGLGGSSRFDGHERRHHGHRQGPPQDRPEEQQFGQRNDSSEEDGRPHPHHHRHHGHHDRHHHHHNQTEGHQGHNETGDQDQDKSNDIRPFQFNPFGRKPFGGRPFGRRNGTEEGSPSRDGHRRPYGNRGRWGENDSEEKEHPTTESVTSSSPPEVVEIAVNEEDINVVAEV